jgi:hypothetical protein
VLPATVPRRRHRPATERRRLEERDRHLELVTPAWRPRDYSPYPCMTDKEWAAFTEAAPVPDENPNLTLQACRVCPLAYQVAMEAAGRCWPADYAITPKGRRPPRPVQ